MNDVIQADREAEDYCAALLIEEMGEVLQPLGKAGRFGMDTPGVKKLDGTVDMSITPRTLIASEVGDLLAAIEFSALHGLYDRDAAARAKAAKLAKLLDPEALDNLGRPLAPQPAAHCLAHTPAQPAADLVEAGANKWLFEVFGIESEDDGETTTFTYMNIIDAFESGFEAARRGLILSRPALPSRDEIARLLYQKTMLSQRSANTAADAILALLQPKGMNDEDKVTQS